MWNKMETDQNIFSNTAARQLQLCWIVCSCWTWFHWWMLLCELIAGLSSFPSCLSEAYKHKRWMLANLCMVEQVAWIMDKFMDWLVCLVGCLFGCLVGWCACWLLACLLARRLIKQYSWTTTPLQPCALNTCKACFPHELQTKWT
jgi:hypothetical protein